MRVLLGYLFYSDLNLNIWLVCGLVRIEHKHQKDTCLKEISSCKLQSMKPEPNDYHIP